MRTATSGSRLSRVTGIVLLIALTPLAALAQGNSGLPPPLAEFLSSLPPLPLRQVIGPATGKALNDAIAALKAERYDEARAALGSLTLDRLSPFERANAEHILFRIAYADGEYGEARQHILNAIDSGGLNEQETANAQDRLKQTDALATAPPT